MDHVVGQILVQIGQTVGILAERLVLAAQSVAGGDATETLQVDHVESADVVLAALQVVSPVTGFPESEP